MKKSQFLRLADEIEAALNEYLKLKIEASSSQARLQNRRPDSFELRALGTILDDVYHGAESICKRIAEEIDRHVPQGASSHRDLLDQIAKEVPTKRPPVIQLQTKQQLDEYRGFRHVFRHVYGFELDWHRMEPLLNEANATIDAFAADIQKFIAFLRMMSDSDAYN